ncbi:MAG TPA: DUF1858 domain-containing protein [Prolixibacteraceae bacterium]|nr:DUF1858 domain-containing protein [Prolixibacteraceae bacterium]
MKDENKLIITPKTKVLHLIESYPQLEDVLIEYAPAFKKLKNPVLRKTVAKIATLQQAASIGNVKVEDLINRLRKEVGQDVLNATENAAYNTKQPGWFDETKIGNELNASEMLQAGEHPVNQVISDLKKLNPGEIYQLKAPFVPAPIIDKATSLGFKHWVNKKSEEEVFVYFFKLQD